MFHWVNGWPDWLLYVLWLPIQRGTLVHGALWGVAAAWATHSWDIAIATAVAVPLKFLGTGEGVAIALGADGEAFAVATIGGFLWLTVWLLATGVGLLRDPGPERAPQTPVMAALESGR